MPDDVAVAPAIAVPDHHVVLDGRLVFVKELGEAIGISIGHKKQVQEQEEDNCRGSPWLHHAADDAKPAERLRHIGTVRVRYKEEE